MTVFFSHQCRPLKQHSKRILLISLISSVKLPDACSNGKPGGARCLPRQLSIEDMGALLSAKAEIKVSGYPKGSRQSGVMAPLLIGH